MKQKYITFLCFFFISVTSIFSQIVNEGILEITSSTVVYFGGQYTNNATHNNDGNLHLNSNFINNGTTTSTAGTTYFEGASLQSISGSTSEVYFNNLEVNNSSEGISVVDNFGLFVEKAVTLTVGDLRLVGEAQLIQVDDAAANLGDGKLLRDQQGISTTTGYNYWTSPVNTGGAFSLNGGLFDGTDSGLNLFSPQQVLFNSGSPYNGVPSVVVVGNVTTPLEISLMWLYTYPASGGWNKIDQNTALNPGVGFSMKGTGEVNQNYVFKGSPNNGNYSFSVNNGQTILIGNPYPSALDVVPFINDNLSINQVLFWVDGETDSHYLAAYKGGYGVRNLSGGVAPSAPVGIFGVGTAASKGIPTRYIAVSQGFFLTAINNVDIVFKNSQRIFKTENGTDSNFYKNAKTKKDDFPKTTEDINSYIRIGYEDPEGFHRQLLLGFLPNSEADANYNRGYDAFMAGPRQDELFFIIEDDVEKKYVIQGVGAFDDTYEFPLGLIIEEEGVHTIMLDAVENFNETVYIKDVVLDTIYNLSASNFKPNLPTGEYLNRFKLVFKDKDQIIVDDTEVDPNIKAYYNENKSIIIKNQSQIKLYNVFIYNMLGQKLAAANTTLLSATEISIPFDYKKGMYLVLIETEQGKKHIKL